MTEKRVNHEGIISDYYYLNLVSGRNLLSYTISGTEFNLGTNSSGTKDA